MIDLPIGSDSLAHHYGGGCSVRRSPSDPKRWFFDFDAASPGGRGGASIRLDAGQALASIDAIHRNVLLPPRSTGGLIADGLHKAGLTAPVILEAYNVERATRYALITGGKGQGTRIGNLLEDIAKALGGSVNHWEPIQDGSDWHLRIHITYP